MVQKFYKHMKSLMFALFFVGLSHLSLMSGVSFSSSANNQTLEAVQQFNAREQQPSNPNEEASWTANQYQNISRGIQADQKNKIIPTGNIFNMSVFTQIKRIADSIGKETRELIELIMPGKPQTKETQQKVGGIIQNLDSQRQSLSNYLGVQQPKESQTFKASKYDRPKDKKFHVYSPR